MMEASEVKKLFSFTEEKAQLVADLCNGEIFLDQFENKPRQEQEQLVLAAINDIIRGCGVEAILDDDNNVIAEYVNTGETYSGTVLYDHALGEYILSTWGDWYEAWEHEEEEDNDTTTCGWCSHRTPNNKEEWHEVICELCHNYVDGKPGPKPKKDEDDDWEDDEDDDWEDC